MYSWHWEVLSEGVAWSGIALLAAETTVMARRPSRRHAWQWIIAIAFNTVRVTSGLTALATIPVIWKAGWRSYWWVIVLAIPLCVSPLIQQPHTGSCLNECQVDSIILGRAIHNPILLTQLRAAGMPWPIDQRWILQEFPDREEMRKTHPEFVSWLETHGQTVIITTALSYPEQTIHDAFHAVATVPLYTLTPERGNQFATKIQRAFRDRIGVITIMVMSCILGCWWVALVLLTAVVTAAGGAGWEVGRHIVHVAVWELAALFVCMEQVRWRGLALLRKVRERAA